jgi:pimeloyl-ACP methyl ester carboxylesterase
MRQSTPSVETPDAVEQPALRYVQANGLRFAYLEQGAGPLALFLHGFPDNAWSYEKQMRAFADAGYHVVCPFLRGYAPTEIPADRKCDPATLGKDVEELIIALSPSRKAYVVGMDWGGTSLQAALVTCPQLIAAAIVMNAAHPATLVAFARDPAQVRSVFHFWFFQSQVAPIAVAAENMPMVDYLWNLWSPGLKAPEHIKRVKETLSSPGVLGAVLPYYQGLLQAGMQRTFPIGEINVPTLAIYGANDPTAKYSALEEPFFKGPYQRIVQSDVGHWPHREREAEFNRLALDWFGRFPASPHSVNLIP